MSGLDDSLKSSLGEYLSKITETNKFTLNEFIDKVDEMQQGGDRLNKVFGQTKQRFSEMMLSVADTAPRITRLGGDLEKTVTAIEDISKATNRNILATTESTEKLYATAQVLGQDIKTLVTNFSDVGVQFSQIGPQMEESVSYVQSLGLNTEAIMDNVVSNTKQLNSYNFADGVQGLTKMAAKAAMLKVDMGEVFRFADQTMNPEGAIKMASAFQRLGVSAGNLVDPFALMNDSINDPGALQDSIANIAKQYTYFDEKTKSFRINPQGILTLKQIAGETQIGYDTLTKAGLAASELDARLSKISPSIKFDKEEDKQFLANIGQMNEKGDYIVKVKDEKGQERDKLLSEVTQQEFDRLIEEQKKAPKTMEDIQKAQLSASKNVESDVSAIKEAVLRGLGSAGVIRQISDSGGKILRTATGAASDALARPSNFREPVDEAISTITTAVKDLVGGNKNFSQVMEEAGKKFGVQGTKMSAKLGGITKEIFEKIQKDVNGTFKSTGIEGSVKNAFENLTKPQKDKLTKFFDDITPKEAKTKVGATMTTSQDKGTTASTATGNEKIESYSSSILYGTKGKIEKPVDDATYNVPKTVTTNANHKVDYGGTITVKVDAPSGVSVDYLNQFLNSEKFKEMIYNYIQEKNKQLEKTK